MHKHDKFYVENLRFDDVVFNRLWIYDITVQAYGAHCPGLYSLVDFSLNRVDLMVGDEGDVEELYWHSCCCNPTHIFDALKSEFPEASFMRPPVKLYVVPK